MSVLPIEVNGSKNIQELTWNKKQHNHDMGIVSPYITNHRGSRMILECPMLKHKQGTSQQSTQKPDQTRFSCSKKQKEMSMDVRWSCLHTIWGSSSSSSTSSSSPLSLYNHIHNIYIIYTYPLYNHYISSYLYLSVYPLIIRVQDTRKTTPKKSQKFRKCPLGLKARKDGLMFNPFKSWT
jgi:hypothetical protein